MGPMKSLSSRISIAAAIPVGLFLLTIYSSLYLNTQSSIHALSNLSLFFNPLLSKLHTTSDSSQRIAIDMSSTIKLNDGTVVPWLAFGTGTALYQRSATDAAIQALSLGFTHLDTAQMYQNEDTLGEALSSSTIPRDKLYITTKLAEVPAGKTVEDTLRESLTKLKVDYVDLFLVHVPTQHLKREGGIKQVWKEMVEVKQKGLTKSIGVSNFNKAYLEEIIGLGLDVPAVNQVLFLCLIRSNGILFSDKSHGRSNTIFSSQTDLPLY